MKSISTYRLVLVIVSLSLINIIKGQTPPDPIGIESAPSVKDSVEIKINKINPAVTFKDTSKVADSLSIDRSLFKALNLLGDESMKNISLQTGYQTWSLATFYYDPLPNQVKKTKVYRAVNKYVPGASSFLPTTNLYYSYLQKSSQGDYTVNVFLLKDNTGLYELGSYAMTTTPTTLKNSVPKPIVKFPIDYNTPNNVDNMLLKTTGSGIINSTILNVKVDAFGSLEIASGDPGNPTIKTFDNCLRVVTHSIDTADMGGTGIFIYTEAKFYDWYAPGIIEPIVKFAYAKIRNNLDNTIWTSYPELAWHDEVDMSYVSKYWPLVNTTEVKNNTNNFIVYPNPSSGQFSIFNNSNNKNLDVTVTDLLGNEVIHKIYNNTSKAINIDLTNQSKGIYLVKVNTGVDIITKKIIVK